MHPEQPPPPPPPPENNIGISNRDWGEATSARYSVRILLPEAKAWSIDDAREPWWTARHPASQSELLVRTWRASRLSTREECLSQIRLWKPQGPDPDKDPAGVVDRRPLGAPEGFDTELDVGVVKSKTPGEFEGYALAIGHSVGRCFAALYTTHASGTRAEDVIAARLALIGDSVLPRLQRVSIEDRVPPP